MLHGTLSSPSQETPRGAKAKSRVAMATPDRKHNLISPSQNSKSEVMTQQVMTQQENESKIMATPEANRSEVAIATPEAADKKHNLVTGKNTTLSPAYSPTLPHQTAYYTARTNIAK